MVANKALEAARTGDLETLKSIEKTSEVKDNHGATCLHYAARGGRVSAIKYLVQERRISAIKRSNVGATAAHDAAATGNLSALQWILDNTDCKVDDQDGTGATVLHLAARYGHTQTVRWLVEKTNCDILKKTASGALPLHFAVVGGDIHCVKLLVDESPRSVNMQMNNGVTTVYLACQDGRINIAKYLVLQAGGSARMTSYDGMSVLHAAAQMGHLDCVKWLIEEQNLDPNERDFDGATPLHFAASRSHAAIIQWMLQSGGARVTMDNLGGTPLHNAAEVGHRKCIKALLQYGCDPEIVDNKGLTAAELAEKCHQVHSAALIRGEEQLEEDVTRVVTSSPRLPPITESPTNSPKASGSVNLSNSSVQSNRFPEPLAHIDGISRSRPVNERPISLVSVRAEVHNCSDCSLHSQETGESECLRLRNPSLSSLEHSPFPATLRLPSPPVSPPFAAGNRGSLVSELSSAASTLSSLSASASREFEDSEVDLQEVRFVVPSSVHQRPPFSFAQSQFETKSSTSCEESGEVIASLSPRTRMEAQGSNSTMAASVPNGGNENATVKKTVIQISGNNVRINDGSGTRDIHTSPESGNQASSSNSVSVKPGNSHAAGAKVTAIPSSVQRVNSAASSTIHSNGSASLSNGPTAMNSMVPGSSRPAVNSSGTSAQKPLPMAALIMSSVTHARTPSPPPHTSMPTPPAPPPPPPVDNGVSSQSNGSPAVRPSTVSNTLFLNQNGMTNGRSPVIPRHDFVAELQQAAGGTALRKTKGPSSGGTNMVFSFGGKNQGQKSKTEVDKQKPAESQGLEGEFDPKHFLDKIPLNDSSGQPIPQWRRPILAKQMAEKVKKETEERRRIEAEEARFRNVPAWKRALLEKKEAQGSK